LAHARAEYQREYRRLNREEVVANQRLYYETNKERILAWGREYYGKNREKCIASSRAWLSKHPEAKRAHEQARRAVKRFAHGAGVSPEEWSAILNEYDHHCAYCNNAGPMTMDHIVPLSGGGAHEAMNIAPACERCNKSKGDTPLFVWLSRNGGRPYCTDVPKER